MDILVFIQPVCKARKGFLIPTTERSSWHGKRFSEKIQTPALKWLNSETKTDIVTDPTGKWLAIKQNGYR